MYTGVQQRCDVKVTLLRLHCQCGLPSVSADERTNREPNQDQTKARPYPDENQEQTDSDQIRLIPDQTKAIQTKTRQTHIRPDRQRPDQTHTGQTD